MKPMIPIHDEATLRRALALPRVLLYKHSPICNVSDTALNAVERFRAAHPELPVYVVDVIGDRPLSRRIEADLGVRHESPQALYLEAGTVRWHDSHFRITEQALAEHTGSGS